MSRKFIASILAVSIAVTGLTAAPAKADSDDLVRFLAGATALVIIGRALDDNDRHTPTRRHTAGHGRAYDDNYIPPERRHEPRRSRYSLPRECRSSFWTPDGKQRYLDRRCLRHNYDYTHSLPKRCKITFYDKNVRKRGYSIPCLKDNGYRLARY